MPAAPRTRPHAGPVRLLAVGTALALAALALQALDVPRTAPRADAASAATVSIWGDAAPAGRVVRLRARTVATRFRTSAPGVVTALRYYSARRATVPVRMRLWDAAGRELASVRLPRGARGWRSRALGRAVRLAAGTTYVVGYTVPRGRVSRAAGVFRSGRVVRRGTLVALGSLTGRGTAAPARASSAAYFADVRFRPDLVSAPGAGGVPPGTPPPPTPSGPPTAPPGDGHYPTADTAGVPQGWEPTRTVEGTLTITTPGEVVEDVRVVGGGIEVAADDVTLRRVEVVGGWIGNWPETGSCTKGLLMQQVSVVAAPGQDTTNLGAAISTGGYTADRVKIDGLPEGFRVGGALDGCGPVSITHSFVRIERPTDCGTNDWHGDGLQGYQGGRLTVRDSRFILDDTALCEGTAPFFYPDQDNSAVDIDGLIAEGGGYPFRLGTAGTVRHLYVVAGSYRYGALDVKCDLLQDWDAHEATLDDAGQPVPGQALPCTTR